MAKWTLHRLWARYQLLVGISDHFGIAHKFCGCMYYIYIIYGLPVCPCDGSTKPLIFLWPSQVALLFPGQGSQYVKMMGTVKDMPAVKEIWDCQLQLPIIQVRNAFVQNHVNVAFLCISRFNSETLGVSFLMYYPQVSFLITRGRFTQTVE